LVAVLAIAGVLAACSDQVRLGIEEFTNLANEECNALREASDAFRKAQDPTFQGEEVTRHVDQVANRLRELVGNLDELGAPEALDADVQELLEVLEEYADGLEALGEQTGPNQTFQVVLEEHTEEVNRLNELSTRATELVGELGLAACILQI
jgi:hypothetical protein